jgi:D-cysteine desulfhydrase
MSGPLGNYPTPVFRPVGLKLQNAELWIKNDGVTHPRYGGNKVRKLGPLLERAEQLGALRILTAGGAGSHHVLATTFFARHRGIATAAVLCPQPRTEHVEQTLRCALAWGLEAIPVGSMAAVPYAVLDHWRSGDLVVPVGGWGVTATNGYWSAANELADQVARGELPEPDVIVVALGSGGTAAGLLAGLVGSKLGTLVLGASVAVRATWLARQLVIPLALQVSRSSGRPVSIPALKERLLIDTSRLGAGYGARGPGTDLATSIGKDLGLALDQTYTAKAFATALEIVGHPGVTSRTAVRRPQDSRLIRSKHRPFRVLYWHTLAATPLEPLLAEGPVRPSLPERLRMLLQGS